MMQLLSVHASSPHPLLIFHHLAPSPPPTKLAPLKSLQASPPLSRHPSHRPQLCGFLASCSLHGRSSESALSLGKPLLDEQELLLKKRAGEIAADLRGTCIFLIGMMGSGKSTVGRILAKALGYYFFDSDKIIEDASGGSSVAQIFEEENEENFRDAETEVLKQLSCMGRLVVATGGGIVVRPINWSYLSYGIVVWLDVPLEALAERVVSVGPESRPLLGQTTTDYAYSQALDKLSKIYDERAPSYTNADVTVSLPKVALKLGYEDLSLLAPSTVAIEVLEEIDKLVKHKKRMNAQA